MFIHQFINSEQNYNAERRHRCVNDLLIVKLSPLNYFKIVSFIKTFNILDKTERSESFRHFYINVKQKDNSSIGEDLQRIE